MKQDNCGYQREAHRIIEKYFPFEEKNILANWAGFCKITNAGKISQGNSVNYYVLLKFPDDFCDDFGLKREIVAVINPFQKFEPRTYQVFDKILDIIGERNRVEKICYIIFSADSDIEKSLREMTGDKDSQVIIPFDYNEAKKIISYQVSNKFRNYFYSRDLFDVSTPLKEDYYFFGRSNLSTEIIQKHRENQNSGLFGLRKTGKTSILFDVMRKCVNVDVLAVFVDCQNTSFSKNRWNRALYYIVEQAYHVAGLDVPFNEDDFTETNASKFFEHAILELFKKTNKTIIFLFDEIENITFKKSPVQHWSDGSDFVFFWQSIRSVYQKIGKIFTFCIFGTNPMCVETPTVGGADNPIFNMFTPNYIKGFDVGTTNEMVGKLGKMMGLNFDDTIYSKLTEDYGGHPFLIRQVCSFISKSLTSRPAKVDRNRYQVAKEKFNRECVYFEQLIEVLVSFYPDEYEVLLMLACDDKENFNYFARNDYGMIRHLVGYGIISENDGEYDFRIDAMKEFLKMRASVDKFVFTTPEAKWQKLTTERNNLEIRLRKMVMNILRIGYGELDAKEYVVSKIYKGDRKYMSFSYAELFDSRKCNIFLKNLLTLINGKWERFKDYWIEQDLFINSMSILTKEGRFDCHANVPEAEEMAMIMSAVKFIDKGVKKFEDQLI